MSTTRKELARQKKELERKKAELLSKLGEKQSAIHVDQSLTRKEMEEKEDQRAVLQAAGNTENIFSLLQVAKEEQQRKAKKKVKFADQEKEEPKSVILIAPNVSPIQSKPKLFKASLDFISQIELVNNANERFSTPNKKSK